MRTHVIACGVFERELIALSPEGVTITFVEQGLHQNPEKMRAPLQEAIDSLAGQKLDRVLLFYGLCSNGVAGLVAGPHGLVIPLSHDCLGLLWGDPKGFEADRARESGTYYLSRGWLEHGAAPLDKLETYRAVMGDEDAEWGLREEFAHYKRLVWIDTGTDPGGSFSCAARANAEYLGLRFEVAKGEGEYLQKLLTGSLDGECLILEPGETLDARRLHRILSA